MDNQVHDEYIRNFNLVKKIIDEWDPDGLLAMECPDDEYHPEIRKITAIIADVNNVEELAAKINDIFTQAFGTFRKTKDCFMIAEKMFKLL